MPVGGLDTVHITFSEEVLVTLNALTLIGMQSQTIPSVSPGNFTYDLATQTATWQFDDELEPGQYLIVLNDSVYDLDKDALDGEFANPWSTDYAAGTSDTFPSGDGEAGGDFHFRFTNLSADFDGDNIVDSADEAIWTTNENLSPNALQTQGDADGDGDVDGDDWDIWDVQDGTNYVDWPSIEPGAILVSTLVDEEDDADYSYGDLSLREALDLAAGVAGVDRIEFAPDLWGETISLSHGSIIVGSDVDIAGPGSDLLTIEADGTTRVMTINSGVEASLSGVTITGGGGYGTGGGLRVNGHLTADSILVTENSATTSGGGIYISATGSLDLLNSTVDNNTSPSGAGILADLSDGKEVNIQNSTVSNNTASGIGGGLLFVENASTVPPVVAVVNSTFSGNSASHGGGIRANNGLATLEFVNSTITDNHATSQGGGIYLNAGAVATLYNTIVADNDCQSTATYNDIRAVNGASIDGASSYNLIGIQGESGLSDGVDGNQVGSVGTPLDPGLAALGYHGGITKTHALLEGSAAQDAGNDSLALDVDDNPLQTDQRAGGHKRVTGSVVDIGAYEYGLYVSSTDDEEDGDYSYGELSLREALTIASTISGKDIISFDDEVFGTEQTIALAGDELEIDSDVEILGPGQNLLTIDAQGNSRVFFVDDGVEAAIRGLSITGGDAGESYSGGGILNQGDLTLSEVNLHHNSAGQGGGVFSDSETTLYVSRSTISDNDAYASLGFGGGIAVDTAYLVDIEDSTIAGNSAPGYLVAGGIGVLFTEEVSIRNTTISGNYAGNGGGGMYLVRSTNDVITWTNVTVTDNETGSSNGGGIYIFGSGTNLLQNSIVADNIGSSGESDIYGTLSSSSSYNLIGTGGSGGLSNGVNGNQVGVADPGLAPLGDYGGPTETHALLAGSPAIDAGDDSLAQALSLDFDQRGEDRYADGDGDEDPIIDIGAFELAADEYFGSL